MTHLQAISAKHFQQIQDEAMASGQLAEAEERTGDHLLPAFTALPALTEEGGEALPALRIPGRPLVDREAPPPLETKVTVSGVDKVQTCVISNELP